MITAGEIVLWLHVTAIVLWVGGSFALTISFIPLVRRSVAAMADARRLISDAASRWQRISRELMLIVLLSGIFNVINVGVAREFRFSNEYIAVLFTKILLFAVLVVIQFWQTYRLVPRYVAALEERSGGTRRTFAVISLVNVILAGTAVFLGLELRFR